MRGKWIQFRHRLVRLSSQEVLLQMFVHRRPEISKRSGLPSPFSRKNLLINLHPNSHITLKLIKISILINFWWLWRLSMTVRIKISNTLMLRKVDCSWKNWSLKIRILRESKLHLMALDRRVAMIDDTRCAWMIVPTNFVINIYFF